MSFSNGVYTAPSGSETAASGQTLQSSVWNTIHTDYATAFNSGVENRYGLIDAEGTIASATTTDLSTVTVRRVSITGNTTITSFGTGANLTRRIRFVGSLILTYNATSLILPGKANITTQAGDIADVESDGSGNWRCTKYTQAATVPAAPVLLTQVVRVLSVSTANTDVAVSIPLPGGVTNYLIDSIRIANATAAANTATVGVFTASGAGGVAIVTASTAVTVTTSLAANNNSAQSFTINNANTEMYATSPIFFRTMANTAAAQVDLFVTYRPL